MPRQLALPFAHVPGYAAADFLPDASNEAALAWLADSARWPQRRLVLAGPPGTGKTHLLHIWAGRTGARLVEGPGLGALLPARGPVAVDDADLAPEAPLLHLLNAHGEAGSAVLLATRAPPARLAVALPDLASRLRAAAVAEIGPPGDALLRALLLRLFSDRQLQVPAPVQEWLLARLPREAGALREAVARIDRAALAAGRRVTRALAAEALAGMPGFGAEPEPSLPAAPDLL